MSTTPTLYELVDRMGWIASEIDKMEDTRTQTEKALLTAIADSWDKCEISLAQLYQLYGKYRQISRVGHHQRWIEAGLPPHQKLSRARPNT